MQKKYLSTFKLSEESESIFNFLETPKLITTSNEIIEETKEGIILKIKEEKQDNG